MSDGTDTLPERLLCTPSEPWRALPAAQQPDWPDRQLASSISRELASAPELVEPGQVLTLRRLLAEVAAGQLSVLQVGDCVEDLTECAAGPLTRKVSLLHTLAAAMQRHGHRAVIPVGRVAGQFAKPRSRLTEWHGDVELPVFRGPLVNSPLPDLMSRLPDPTRMMTCYRAASEAMNFLYREDLTPMETIWTSHEALLLDYEAALIRRGPDGRHVLTSTHWPWIGDRTRQPHGAHVAMLAEVSNPVACKIGPSITTADLLALCERLDPKREPGRLTLITRLGADLASIRLPKLVAAVRRAGYPAIWLCDPMHGNTHTAPNGYKVRFLHEIVREVRAFCAAVIGSGGVPGGLHLETTPDSVIECVEHRAGLTRLGERYTTLCDPRLTCDQALAVVRAWA